MAATQCTIPLYVLTSIPYSLSVEDSVFAKVTAQNIKGSSLESIGGNDGLIITNPDAPINVLEDT